MRISDVVQTCALPISRDSGLGTRDSEKALTFARTVKLAVRRMGRAQRNPSKAEHRTLSHNAPRFQACGRPSFKAKRSPACGRRGPFQDRKSVVSGKSVSVRVDLGVRRLIKKQKNTMTKEHPRLKY